jgi:hypothetical protein
MQAYEYEQKRIEKSILLRESRSNRTQTISCADIGNGTTGSVIATIQKEPKVPQVGHYLLQHMQTVTTANPPNDAKSTSNKPQQIKSPPPRRSAGFGNFSQW